MPQEVVDVAIVGGGPAGSTCASLLLQYNPRLSVAIVERETFPRDHVGESQLPAIGRVLNEMGVWDAVEAAGFPIKIGATYRWGGTDELWDFEFVADGRFVGGPRPGRYVGQRVETAFQVDRAIYDKILLDHARKRGAKLRQPSAVREVRRGGYRVDALLLDDGSEMVARHYVDASGHAGVLRRAMGVETHCPTNLQNIAIWDYWQNADWAVSVGVGGTRVQVLSLGYGWIWFIPLGPTRTSVGLIVPAAYYKASGKRPEALYREAIESDPVVRGLMRRAVSENALTTTKDWSFVADRLAGENWWLAGESAGFADPILAAGMTLAHQGARDVAYAILAAERGDYDVEWLREWVDTSNRAKIAQHIRFADFWYSANGQFTDLQEHTRAIARDAGLDLTPQEAWRWLGTGGFVNADDAGTGIGGYSVGAARAVSGRFLGAEVGYETVGKNLFHLRLEGAEKRWGARLEGGRLYRYRVYRRGGRSLPNVGLFSTILALAKGGERPGTIEASRLLHALRDSARARGMGQDAYGQVVSQAFETLEAMASDGWLEADHDPHQPAIETPVGVEAFIHANRDVALRAGG